MSNITSIDLLIHQLTGMIDSKTDLLEKERSETHNDKLVDALDLMVSDLEYIRLKIYELSASMAVSKYKNTSSYNQDSSWSSLDQDRMCGQFTQQEIDNSTRWK